MKHQAITKSMIIEFSKEPNLAVLERAYYFLSEAVDCITEQLSEINPIIRTDNVRLLVSDDYKTKTALPIGEASFILGIVSAQLELQTINELLKKKIGIWTRFKETFLKVRDRKGRKAERKRKKRERKQKRKGILPEDLLNQAQSVYTIESFKDEYFTYLPQYLGELTLVKNLNSRIEILSREELGICVSLVPAIIADDELRFWNRKKRVFEVERQDRAMTRLFEKSSEIGPNFLSVVRIYKMIFYQLYASQNNQLIESLVYDMPDDIFEGEIYDVFLKTVNYLKFCNLGNIYSLTWERKKLFSLPGQSVYECRKFLNQLSELISE